jgi:serine/threonine protein kinase/tetratricopeptide (TPR) repeat protein
MVADQPMPTSPSLPAAIVSELEAILFRGGSPSERDAAVAAVCAQHPEHEAAIRPWLAAVLGLGDGGFTEEPRQIGPYRLIARLGQGGFGDVHLAEQEQPVRRRVALKVLKLGMDSAQVLQRFAREQDALARMNHDAIAKIYDAGTTPTGQPFFAMELVDGAPLTVYCDREALRLRERLALFSAVCLGVHHAHQKGVVHRDLKPSNVLVAKVGERHQPKLIDFGIARALEGDSGTPTLTETGMLLGTPAYMAPEQARGDLAAIDTRTDVYALGALLFELLTGDVPFGSDPATPSSPWDLRQRILEEATPRPSARRASTTTQASSWQRQLRGELDWIVLRAMAKEPERRYASAAELAADIDRYLAQEPVSAGPPSASYRLRTFVRRHRLQVGAAAAVLVTAVGGTVVSWRWAMAAEASAALAEERAVQSAQLAKEKAELATAETDARTAAQAAATEAEKRSRELAAVVQFQATQLGDLDVSSVGSWLREHLLAAVPADRREVVSAGLAGVNFTDLAMDELEANIFERSLRSIEAQFAEQPELQARLLQVVAETLRNLGAFAQAEAPQRLAVALRRRALGDDHPDTVQSISHLAILAEALGRLDDAESSYREVLERNRRVHGPLHPESQVALHNMAILLESRGRIGEAEAMLRDAAALARTILPVEDLGRLESIVDHAGALLTLDRVDEAAALLAEVGPTLSALPDDPRVRGIVRKRGLMQGRLHSMRGDLAAAEAAFRGMLPSLRQQLGDRHPTTLRGIANLGNVLSQRGAYDEAEQLLESALESSRQRLGPLHDETLSVQLSLAAVVDAKGRRVAAEAMLREVYAGRLQLYGRVHTSTLACLNNLAANVLYQGRSAEAEELFAQVAEVSAKLLGAEHRQTLGTMHNLAFLAWRGGRNDDARTRLRELVPKLERTLGVEHLQTLQARQLLAAVLTSLGEQDEALAQHRADLPLLRKVAGEDHPETWTCQAELAALAIAQRRHEEAAPLLTDLVARRRRVLGDEDPPTMQLMNDLMQVELVRQRFADAVTVGRDVVALAERRFGLEHANARLVRGNLAIALERAGDPAEAERLLRQNLSSAQAAVGESPPRVVEAGYTLGTFLVRQRRFKEAESVLSSARGAAITRLGEEHGLVRVGAKLLAELFEAWQSAEPDPVRGEAARQWRARAGV